MSNHDSISLQSFPGNIRVALDAAPHQTKYSTVEWREERESFIVWLRDKLEDSEACRKPTVHAELAMITAMFKGELPEVLPYIGVSKLSCIMCIHYIQAINEIAVKGSHGKAYPGWSWPSLPSHDRENPVEGDSVPRNKPGGMKHQKT
ncbi:uncharacterized protein EI90DRAFT_3156738 [Cantharellus anzutake]|uniref:uncharacterized protein n=1 Tax=Cantharellus anzutake TaxID=1750568 RepID=UPI0019044104|nr:uncharacterized protein EI90DRAFT_3156738 [Cantharellus anzutake]KAF8326043.1 hypothetical protein EI90DRAFT_3156738 [Cantharellus anzutake]